MNRRANAGPRGTDGDIEFGARLRAWRDGRGLDLDAASRLLGVSANFIYTIERGVHEPSRSLRARFEEAARRNVADPVEETVRRVPVLSWVQAGRATRYEEIPADWMDWAECICPDPQAFALRVIGDSMFPPYHEGDLAICMPSYPPRNNALAVAKVAEDLVTFKKVRFRGAPPTTFRLIALNTRYSPLIVPSRDIVWIYPVHCVISRFQLASAP